MAAGRLIWTHRDSSGDLDSLARRAFVVAKAGAWQPTDEHAAMLRAWLVAMHVQMATLGPRPPTLETAEAIPAQQRWRVEPKPSADPARRDWQNMLSAGLVTLVAPNIADLRRIADDQVLAISTVDGEAAQTGNTAAIGVVAGVVIVGCVAALAAATWGIAGQANEVIDRWLARDSKRRELAGAMTASAELIAAHRQLEESSGHEIPYDAQELEQLKTLRGTIKDLATWEPPALKSVPDAGKISSGAGNALQLGGLAIPIVIGLVLYELLQPRVRTAA
jgi:hypothetical protein